MGGNERISNNFVLAPVFPPVSPDPADAIVVLSSLASEREASKHSCKVLGDVGREIISERSSPFSGALVMREGGLGRRLHLPSSTPRFIHNR